MIFHRRQFVLDQFFNTSEHQDLTHIAKRQRNPRRLRSRGATDPVDITLGIVRQFVVDDMRDPFDIDSTRHDIRSHQNPDPASIESSKAALPSVLTFIRVDSVGGNPAARKMPQNAVRTMLRARKHQCPSNIFTL